MTLDCDAVRELAAELALGLVGGPERAAALAHLDSCPSCRGHVDSLARTGDSVLVLAPGSEPPSGFETRVVDRLRAEIDAGRPPVASARPHRWLAAAVSAAAAAVALVAGVLIGRADEDGRRYAEATMRAADGEYVGELVVGGGEQAFVFIAVPAWEPDGPPRDYVVRIELAGDDPILVRDVSLAPGSGTWGAVLDVDPDDVVAVALLGEEGRVWCSARVD